LHPDIGRTTSQKWYVGEPARTTADRNYREKVRVHELLHLFGLFDDYPARDQGVWSWTIRSLARDDPDFVAGLRDDSIMNGPKRGIFQGLTDRHLSFFRRAIQVAKENRHHDPWAPPSEV
jgi:ADP-ribose pyrophosphatase YjhB (NUDIX family)